MIKKIKFFKKNKKFEIKFLLIYLYISICLALFAVFLLMLGIHSIDNSLNALIYYGSEKWFYSCDIIEYKLDEKNNFAGSCILFPSLYILGLRLSILSAFLLFVAGAMLGSATKAIEKMLKEKVEKKR